MSFEHRPGREGADRWSPCSEIPQPGWCCECGGTNQLFSNSWNATRTHLSSHLVTETQYLEIPWTQHSAFVENVKLCLLTRKFILLAVMWNTSNSYCFSNRFSWLRRAVFISLEGVEIHQSIYCVKGKINGGFQRQKMSGLCYELGCNCSSSWKLRSSHWDFIIPDLPVGQLSTFNSGRIQCLGFNLPKTSPVWNTDSKLKYSSSNRYWFLFNFIF